MSKTEIVGGGNEPPFLIRSLILIFRYRRLSPFFLFLRQFHAAGSESTPGLNDAVKSESSERLSARLQRMHDAKELAGMYN